ncbi:MAG: ThuA domain-containing protein, partial [Planctomycetaceae bacterium]
PRSGETPSEDSALRRSFTTTPREHEPVSLELVLPTGKGDVSLAVSYHTNEDGRPRALPLRRVLLPWVTTSGEPTIAGPRRLPEELAGGSWARGRTVFFSEQAACSKCHTLHGEGGKIGPDLSNLVHRDYRSVLRDVTEPSFAINPDYVTHTVVVNDGRVLTGTARTEGDVLHVGDEKGRVTTVPKTDVEEMRVSPISTMPKDVPKLLGEERMRDLLTFLLTPPPHMPDYGPNDPPPPRTRAEVEAVLAGAAEPPSTWKPLHIALVAGAKDHGPGEHDYPAWLEAWKELLSAAEGTRVTTTMDWPSPEDFRTADVIVFYQRGQWSAERAGDIDAFLARGGGLVYIHWAVNGGSDASGLAERIGLASTGGIRFRHGPLELHFDRGSKHPIARNFRTVKFVDESYWRMTGDPERIDLLATGIEEHEPQPLFWTMEPNGGRVFVSILGHYAWTFDDPLFRVLLLRGIAWSANEPVDRYNELVPLGARIAE